MNAFAGASSALASAPPFNVSAAPHPPRASDFLGLDHEGHCGRAIGASVGLVQLDASLAPHAEQWLASAGAACYHAKGSGRGRVRMGLLERPAPTVPQSLILTA